jgi:hypothetical protein
MLTRHAAARMQQRGIGAREVADLLAFGRDVHDRHARREARRTGVTGARLDRLAGVYHVEVGGGAIATVGHRHRRRQR